MEVDQINQRTPHYSSICKACDFSDMLRCRKTEANSYRQVFGCSKAAHSRNEAAQMGWQVFTGAGDAAERDAVDETALSLRGLLNDSGNTFVGRCWRHQIDER